MGNEIEGAVAKTIPPAAVTTLTFLNIQLADWVYILTAIYLLLQIIYLAKKIIRK